MDTNAVLQIAGVVAALSQFAKWFGVPDKWGAVVVLGLSLVATVLWGFSQDTFERRHLFAYLSAWITVALNAAGMFGFAKAARSVRSKGGEVSLAEGQDGMESLAGFDAREIKGQLQEQSRKNGA